MEPGPELGDVEVIDHRRRFEVRSVTAGLELEGHLVPMGERRLQRGPMLSSTSRL